MKLEGRWIVRAWNHRVGIFVTPYEDPGATVMVLSIDTGVYSGPVSVRIKTVEDDVDSSAWEDIFETAVAIPIGQLIIGPEDEKGLDLMAVTTTFEGTVRIYSRGRDIRYDELVVEPTEEHCLVFLDKSNEGAEIIKAGSSRGAETMQATLKSSDFQPDPPKLINYPESDINASIIADNLRKTFD